MKFSIKKDVKNVILDVIVGIIPLVALIAHLGITLRLFSIYFLVVGVIYYLPLIMSYILPKTYVSEDSIRFSFLMFKKEINFNDIQSYSLNVDSRNTVFCKSKDNICLELNKNHKCISFSPNNKQKMITLLKEKNISWKY